MRLLYQENTWEDLKEAAEEGYIVVLPVGVIEQHGPQLPVGTDNYLAEVMTVEGAKEAKKKYGVKVMVLPVLNYGVAVCCENFPGTVSIPVESYLRFVTDIIKKLILKGFTKVVIVSGHGANPLQTVRRMIKEWLNAEKIKGAVYTPRDTVTAGMYSNIFPESKELHAGEVETSQILSVREDLVRMDRAKKPRQKPEPLHTYSNDEITDTGATGDPTLATGEKGELCWAVYRERLGRYLYEVSAEEI